jgi:hypothetical protein
MTDTKNGEQKEGISNVKSESAIKEESVSKADFSKKESAVKEESNKKEPVVVKKSTPEPILKYKLNFRRLDGSVRYDLKKEVVNHVSIHYGDLLRTISHNKFMTMDEIVDATWAFEAKSVKKLWVRSRKSIEEGVLKLVELGIAIENGG